MEPAFTAVGCLSVGRYRHLILVKHRGFSEASLISAVWLPKPALPLWPFPPPKGIVAPKRFTECGTLSISLAEKKRKEVTLLTAFLSVVNLLFRRRIVKLKSITLNGVFTRHSL